MTDLEKFVALYHAEKKRLGLESSVPMKWIDEMDSSDTPTYTVMFVPRRPQPKGGAPKV